MPETTATPSSKNSSRQNVGSLKRLRRGCSAETHSTHRRCAEKSWSSTCGALGAYPAPPKHQTLSRLRTSSTPKSSSWVSTCGTMKLQRAHSSGSTPSHTTAWSDRKSVVSGKSGSVRVDLGGRRIIKKKKKE